MIPVWVVWLFFGFAVASAAGEQNLPDETTHPFHITIETEDETIVLQGSSELMITPSSYSIHMNEVNGRCAIHMLNFKTAPGPGTYDVENSEQVRTTAVCVLENVEAFFTPIGKSVVDLRFL